MSGSRPKTGAGPWARPKEWQRARPEDWKGVATEARRLLRLTLGDRFPGLETMPELDRIESLSDLESLLIQHAIRSPDRDSVAQAILAAADRRM